jgi:hypothetical protein
MLKDDVPVWVQDYALYLLDIGGNISAWYAGAERIYACAATHALGEHVSFPYPSEDNPAVKMHDELARAAATQRSVLPAKVFPITTPPLRDHHEDIPILVRHFTKRYAAKMGRQIDKIPSETMRALCSWHWPGNVRKLENFIERSVILSSGASLRAPLDEIRADTAQVTGGSTLEEVERDHIMRVLRKSGGVVTTAAVRLGLHRTTLNAMMGKLGISRKDL